MRTDVTQTAVKANQECFIDILVLQGLITHNNQSRESTISEYELTRRQVTNSKAFVNDNHLYSKNLNSEMLLFFPKC